MHCANCGIHGDATVCSDKCSKELDAYLLAEMNKDYERDMRKLTKEEHNAYKHIGSEDQWY